MSDLNSLAKQPWQLYSDFITLLSSHDTGLHTFALPEDLFLLESAAMKNKTEKANNLMGATCAGMVTNEKV